MRNVKREKSLSTIGYEGTDQRSDKMQTMTIADSNTTHSQDQDNQLNSNVSHVISQRNNYQSLIYIYYI